MLLLSPEGGVVRVRRAGVVGLTAAACLVGAGLGVASAVTPTAADLAKPVQLFDFCAERQFAIAQIDRAGFEAAGYSVTNIVYDNFDEFVLSKGGVFLDTKEVLVTQYVEYSDAARTVPLQIRCKFRTGESLDEGAWPPDSPNNSPGYEVDPAYGFGSAVDGLVSEVDLTCQDLHDDLVAGVEATLTSSEAAAATYATGDGTLVTAPDDIALAGPLWTPPFGGVADAGGVLTLQSKALVSPTGTAGLARFEGAHYCTFAAPTYLRDLIIGAVAAPGAP